LFGVEFGIVASILDAVLSNCGDHQNNFDDVCIMIKLSEKFHIYFFSLRWNQIKGADVVDIPRLQ
jgi:hypothetical protein